MFNFFALDFQRYKKEVGFVFHEPSIIIVILYRIRKQMTKFPKVLFPIKFILLLFVEPITYFLTLLFGIHLPKGATIGPGFMIYHFGGIILNSNTVIGKNCTLRHNVTIGNRHEINDVPIIGDNVNIGVGAVIIGRIKIGNNVNIGANAVVLHDVPDNCIAVGNPARVLNKNIK